MIDDNFYCPNKNNYDKFKPIDSLYKYWKPIEEPTTTKWKKIEIWNPSNQYIGGLSSNDKSIVVHNDIVYTSSDSIDYISIEEEPGVSNVWTRLYSLYPDTDIVYGPENPLLFMNNRYYLLESNAGDETLENGITIYINKKWKNILVNIYINDNTLPDISGKNRDDIYTDLHSNLTAFNFITSINDLSNKYGFSDYIKYTIIDEDYNRQTYSYDDGLGNLPYIISCEPAGGLLVKKDSLIIKPMDDRVSVKVKLSNNKIDDISKIDWYNGSPISYNIIENIERPKIFKNYSSNKNIEYIQIQRLGGYYMPIFEEVPIFNKNSYEKDSGNYLFDTELSDFGIIKERKIRKVNRSGSILKNRDSKNDKSIYPMVGEFGYSYTDFMIFKSTWDKEYHIEDVLIKNKRIREDINKIQIPKTIGQPAQIKVDNNKKYIL